jgi:hypothetical protein
MHETQDDRAFRLEDIEAALARAAARARKMAAEAGQPIVLYRDGRIIKEYVTDEQPASAPPSDAA